MKHECKKSFIVEKKNTYGYKCRKEKIIIPVKTIWKLDKRRKPNTEGLIHLERAWGKENMPRLWIEITPEEFETHFREVS